MDNLLFACFSLIALCHLFICARHRKRPHWSAGISWALAGIVCPLGVAGVALLAFGALLIIL